MNNKWGKASMISNAKRVTNEDDCPDDGSSVNVNEPRWRNTPRAQPSSEPEI